MANQNTRIELRNRAENYARQRGLSLTRSLGFGNDGAVWETSRGSAVKVEERQLGYDRELATYLRLKQNHVMEINGFTIPRLLDHADDLLAIEMTMVFPPCLLDFAKSYLDQPPDFTPEVLAEWESATKELFDDRWPIVRRLLANLRGYAIYYFDAKPANIRFVEHE